MKFGKTETSRGTFHLKEDASLTNQRESIPIHSADFNFGDPPAGWGRLEPREDGIWLTDISWSQAAKKLFEREPLYLAPAFTVSVDGEVDCFSSASLTATPADPNATRIE